MSKGMRDEFGDAWGFDGSEAANEGDFDPMSPEEIAELKRRIQDLNDDPDMTYTWLTGEEYTGMDDTRLRCNKCGREGGFMEKPFPHKLNCEMARRYGR